MGLGGRRMRRASAGQEQSHVYDRRRLPEETGSISGMGESKQKGQVKEAVGGMVKFYGTVTRKIAEKLKPKGEVVDDSTSHIGVMGDE